VRFSNEAYGVQLIRAWIVGGANLRRFHAMSLARLSCSTELGGARVSETDSLQKGCERRALRGLGTATFL
jgi:hypothetical protein